MKTKKMAGWGRFPSQKSPFIQPHSLEALPPLLQTDTAGYTLRGLGRSYGDAALPADNPVLETVQLNRILAFDAQSGEITCESGVSFEQILKTIVPQGWFLPVTPGTKFITLGGAIAHDVHGKNHHRDGSFGRFVRRLSLLTADGGLKICSRTENTALFYATLSGAGLTGLITQATFQLLKIETAFIQQHSIKAQNLTEAFALLSQYEPNATYAVAWIDCLAQAPHLGRSLLLFGEHAPFEALPSLLQTQPLALHQAPIFRIPFSLPSFTLNAWTVKAFNALYYAQQRHREQQRLLHYEPYFYPLDAVLNWNRIYGRHGFVQFQCVLPLTESEKGITALLKRVQQYGEASFLAVLKRFGKADEGYLSFPMEGYTLTMDFRMKAGVPSLMADLTAMVREWGGRLYLAKDALMQPADFAAMYPQLTQWLDVKRILDPQNLFRSRLSARLGLF